MESFHILRLPDELLVAVVELLPGDALKATRETCRKLNSVASPYLYPVLYLSCHQLDLDVFRLVANNPLLIGGVKELVIDDTTLSPRLPSYHRNWPDRKKAYDWEEKFETEGRAWSDEPDKDFHALYKSVLKGHHTNRRTHADITALKHALPLFKSLRSLVISNCTADDCPEVYSGAQSQESSSPVVKMWRRLGNSKQERPPFPPRYDWVKRHRSGPEHRARFMDPDYFRDRLDVMINEYGLPPAQGARDAGDENRVAGNRMSYQKRGARSSTRTDFNWLKPHHEPCPKVGREARGLFVALEVLRDPRIRLTEFRVDASLLVGDSNDCYTPTHQPGLSVLLFDNRNNSPLLSNVIASFSACNLTKFHLVLSNFQIKENHSYIGNDIMEQGSVASVPATMPQLEDLLLEPHGMWIFDAMPDTHFRRLRLVEFSCGELDPEALLLFLRQHAETLEALTIGYCCIDPDIWEHTWEDVMAEIRDMQDAKVLNISRGLVISAYDHAPCEGCWKNDTLWPEDMECPIHTWEFIDGSLWNESDAYPWDF